MSYTTADVTQRAGQLQCAIGYLAGQLTLWTHRGQLDTLDRYLARTRRFRSTGNLRQYREFHDAIKDAAVILRASPAGVPALPAPGEYDRPLTETELGPHPDAATGDGWAFSVTVPAGLPADEKAAVIMTRLEAAWNDEGVFSDPDDKGAQWRPVDVPGAGASPPSPAPSEGTVPGPAVQPDPPQAAGPGAQDEDES